MTHTTMQSRASNANNKVSGVATYAYVNTRTTHNSYNSYSSSKNSNQEPRWWNSKTDNNTNTNNGHTNNNKTTDKMYYGTYNTNTNTTAHKTNNMTNNSNTNKTNYRANNSNNNTNNNNGNTDDKTTTHKINHKTNTTNTNTNTNTHKTNQNANANTSTANTTTKQTNHAITSKQAKEGLRWCNSMRSCHCDFSSCRFMHTEQWAADHVASQSAGVSAFMEKNASLLRQDYLLHIAAAVRAGYTTLRHVALTFQDLGFLRRPETCVIQYIGHVVVTMVNTLHYSLDVDDMFAKTILALEEMLSGFSMTEGLNDASMVREHRAVRSRSQCISSSSSSGLFHGPNYLRTQLRKEGIRMVEVGSEMEVELDDNDDSDDDNDDCDESSLWGISRTSSQDESSSEPRVQRCYVSSEDSADSETLGDDSDYISFFSESAISDVTELYLSIL